MRDKKGSAAVAYASKLSPDAAHLVADLQEKTCRCCRSMRPVMVRCETEREMLQVNADDEFDWFAREVLREEIWAEGTGVNIRK